MTDPSIGSLLFEYRFAGKGELAGHNLGNLMLLALDNLCVRPLDAIKLISDMLKIESQLLPMSEFPTDLCAHMECGTQILGEVSIDQLATPPLSLGLMPEVQATREAVLALQQADMIILGPGSFSPPSCRHCCWPRSPKPSTRAAPCCFVCNLVAENGPASQLDLMSQCRWLESRVGQGRLDAILAPQGAG